MNFQVTWVESAEQELAGIWLRIPAEQHAAVRDATNRIDRELKVNAHEKGQFCDGDRLFRSDPLMVFYSVNVDSRTVEVLSVVIRK